MLSQYINEMNKLNMILLIDLIQFNSNNEYIPKNHETNRFQTMKTINSIINCFINNDDVKIDKNMNRFKFFVLHTLKCVMLRIRFNERVIVLKSYSEECSPLCRASKSVVVQQCILGAHLFSIIFTRSRSYAICVL